MNQMNKNRDRDFTMTETVGEVSGAALKRGV